MMLVEKDKMYLKLAAVVCVGGVCLRLLCRRRQLPPAPRLVAVTGCDSGVGYSAALHCHRRGLSVLAMVLNPHSEGAQHLRSLAGGGGGGVEVVQVDVTRPEQVAAAVLQARTLLQNNAELKMHALINNAGVMVFGETEWQTAALVSLQLDVNLRGAINTTRLFAPLLRKDKGRVINVTSHCSLLPLPGLAVYSATKAGLLAWSHALRVEWAKYGISVISLIPGSLFQQTNILSRQSAYAKEMEDNFTEEMSNFYGRYFSEYQQYLSHVPGPGSVCEVDSPALYSMLDAALLSAHPRPSYQHTPWRYWLYHTLATLALTPTRLRDYLVTRFTAMPQYKP